MAKVIYLDEAGTSLREPVAVVAGTIIDIDGDWGVAQDRIAWLKSLLSDDLPSEFVLHAKELYSGGKTLTRDRFGKDLRFRVLTELLQSYEKLRIPLVGAFVRKNEKIESDEGRNRVAHLGAFVQALVQANVAMRRRFPEERATLVVEDCEQMRSRLAQVIEDLRNENALKPLVGKYGIDRIVDQANFVPKPGAPMLQFADAAAFAIRHYVSGHKDGKRVVKRLVGPSDVRGLFRPERVTNSFEVYQWSFPAR